MLHSPACRALRSLPVSLADHEPWWMVMLEDPRRVCGRCDGPAVRDLVPVAGLLAAVDVWHDRGEGRIERWQQAAFQRLLSATSAARAHAREPDITLGWRIVAALNEGAPAEQGWAAYAVVAVTDWNRLGEELERLPLPQRESARALARDRLAALEAVLPASQRPLPLPQAADAEVLRRRYRQLSDALRNTVPQLDRLLFTLPGAR
jgi:hypothetical protein